MAYAERLFSCLGCGAPVWKRAKASAKVRCIHCSIERSIENMHQLRQRRGAFYDKWAAGIAEAGKREVARSRANKAAEKVG